MELIKNNKIQNKRTAEILQKISLPKWKQSKQR